MRVEKVARALLLLAFYLVVATGSGVTAADDFASLRQEARQGKVPVIVTLKTPKASRTAGWQNLGDYIKEAQARALNDIGWRNLNDVVQFERTPAMALEVDSRQLESLRNSATVKGVFKNTLRKASLAQSTLAVGAPLVREVGFDGSSQAVAVLDTGVDRTHPFLRGRVSGEACFSTDGEIGSYQVRSLCPNGKEVQVGRGASAPCAGECSHGTHVAGIVAGSGPDFSGVAPGAEILGVQVFTEVVGYGLSALDSDIMLGLEWVWENRQRYNIAAVNMSLGGGQYTSFCDADSPVTDLIELLKAEGIATVIASGNEYFTDAIASPACISSAISVGATDGRGNVTEFSNSDDELDLLAPGSNSAELGPGVGILSSVPGSGYERYPGTSMAAPHVAGAYAVLRQAAPNASVDELTDILKRSGDTVRDSRNGVSTPSIKLDMALLEMRRRGLVGEGRSDPRPSEDPEPEPKPDPQPEPQPEPEPEKDEEQRIDGVLIIDKRRDR